MKGIVFTEFLDMVENKFGPDMVDDIIDESNLPSSGAYTSVGTYDHHELLSLVQTLSLKTGIDKKKLTQIYGHHLFFRFSELMPVFFEKPISTFDFLKSVHDTIHVEVKKLYPDAALPEFIAEELGPQSLKMTYKSRCPLADFAHGLMQGCADYFNESFIIKEEDHNIEGFYSRVFILTKN